MGYTATRVSNTELDSAVQKGTLLLWQSLNSWLPQIPLAAATPPSSNMAVFCRLWLDNLCRLDRIPSPPWASSISASPSLSILTELLKATVVADAEKELALVAEEPDWEACCDMCTEEGGVMSEGAAGAVMAKPPFGCELIEE